MNMMKKTMIAVAISSVFVVNANAADLNWNYANINYVSNDVFGVSGTGFGVDGSFGVSDNVNITVAYQAPSFLGTTISETKVGVGYHQPTGNGAWYARGEYVSFSSVATVSGFAFSGGARAALSSKFEIDGRLGYASYEGFNGIIFGIDGIYNISDKVGITAGYMSDSDAFGWTGFKVGARMYF